MEEKEEQGARGREQGAMSRESERKGDGEFAICDLRFANRGRQRDIKKE